MKISYYYVNAIWDPHTIAFDFRTLLRNQDSLTLKKANKDKDDELKMVTGSRSTFDLHMQTRKVS